MKITIPISIGELLDKISILKIKLKHIDNDYVKKELNDLIDIAKKENVFFQEYIDKLFEINSKLWKIEDDLRVFEQKKIFNEEFVDLARLVYKYNDQRSEIKKNINEKYNSQYREIKVHK